MPRLLNSASCLHIRRIYSKALPGKKKRSVLFSPVVSGQHLPGRQLECRVEPHEPQGGRVSGDSTRTPSCSLCKTEFFSRQTRAMPSLPRPRPPAPALYSAPCSRLDGRSATLTSGPPSELPCALNPEWRPRAPRRPVSSATLVPSTPRSRNVSKTGLWYKC